MDFPSSIVTPNAPSICPATDPFAPVGAWCLFCNNLVGAAVWPTANTAIYVGFLIEVPIVIRTAAITVSVQSGNLDVGIYDEKGNVIVAKGSTAVAAAGLQTIDLTASVSRGTASPTLGPGFYWAAMNCDNTTASFRRMSPGTVPTRFGALQSQAVGALALPTTATFANPAASYAPCLVFSEQTVI